MRIAPNTHIQDTWNAGGPFIGDLGAPHGRVTVELGWLLRHSTATSFPAGGGVDAYTRGAIRWFQRIDNSQVETEVPNIWTIEIDRTIDTDAGTCKIILYNQQMLDFLGATPALPVVGARGESVEQPGYFTFNRGDSPESQSEWGWTANSWENVLVPNALLRTYQGYGGRDKTISQAVADGNILITGTWLVDSVLIDAHAGTIELSCRDMMKLAIDQQIYPPLVPAHGVEVSYPLYYFRWKDVLQEPIPYGTTVYQEGWTPLEDALTSPTSTTDLEPSTNEAGTLIGGTGTINGHTKGDATDGEDSDTYWLSAGHLSSTGASDMEWIEWNANNSAMNGFSFFPFMGTYLVYVSVMVGGVWQGTHTIPYSGTQYTGAYTPAIHYTDVFKLHFEFPGIAYLSQAYTGVQKFRLTFTNLSKTTVGPKFYRAGLRQIAIGSSTKFVEGSPKFIVDIIRASDSEEDGYWIVGNDGGVFTYGPDLKFFGSEGSKRLSQNVIGAFSDGHSRGYALVAQDGGIFAFGDVPYKGSLPGQHIVSTSIVDVERGCGAPSYKGYWVLQADGAVFTYGTATYHGNAATSTLACGITRDASGNGYWIVDIGGNVFSQGSATYHGGSPTLSGGEIIVDIESTSTGNGYWLVGNKGSVFAFGDATYHGGMNNVVLNGDIVSMCRTFDDGGYALVGNDGGVFNFGNSKFFGSLPEAFSFSADGNYKDYADIVKDLLLWSGWWAFDPSLGDLTPAGVFGNIETTGIYSPQSLTEDFFDKKPVVDVINTLKEIVGFIIWTDEIGAFHFESPNIWSIGNFLETGVATAYTFNVDELHQIFEYQLTYSAADARTTITIASADPQAKFADTIATSYVSAWGTAALRGIVSPALWVNGQFVDKSVQLNMAKLIDLHLFMQSRQGQVSIQANPLFQINDQIRIFERQTSDTYYHYLRGYSSTMDLQAGKYEMTCQTHWMGDGHTWFLSFT